MQNYRLHKLKKGDTVDSVALELGITTLEVRGFHNIYCHFNDTIGYDFPENLIDLLVYPHIREFKKENYPTAQFVSGHTLGFKPNPKKVNYGVHFTIATGDSEINTIKYETSIEYVKQDEKGNFLYSIDRLTPIYIDNEQANLLLDELAEKTAKVLYPLGIIVNQEGKWIGIHNFKDIKNRWENVKSKIYDEYQNDWADEYIELTELSLEAESNLVRSLSNDWFLNSFFSGIYNNYTGYYKFENTLVFPMFAHIKALKYKVEQKIDKYLDDYNQVIIDQEGQVFDNRTKADLKDNMDFAQNTENNTDTDKVEGNFRAKYFLNPNNNNITSMYWECAVRLDTPKKIEIVVTLID